MLVSFENWKQLKKRLKYWSWDLRTDNGSSKMTYFFLFFIKKLILSIYLASTQLTWLLFIYVVCIWKMLTVNCTIGEALIKPPFRPSLIFEGLKLWSQTSFFGLKAIAHWVRNFRMRFSVFFVFLHPFLSKCMQRMRKRRKSNLIQKKIDGRKFRRQCANVIDTTWGRIYFLMCENFGLSVQRP